MERTFFKRPKAGNQRLVVPVRDDFVIDFNLFALDEVHKAQAASGGNICLKKDCGCQSLALVRGFTEALAGTDDHRRAQLEQRVMRALIEDNQTSKGSGGSGSTPSKQASSEARSSEADSGDEGDGGGGGDMLSMLMGAAVSDSDSDSDSEGALRNLHQRWLALWQRHHHQVVVVGPRGRLLQLLQHHEAPPGPLLHGTITWTSKRTSRRGRWRGWALWPRS